MDKKQYFFKGAVKFFDKVITPEWVAKTYAVSPSQALSNLSYRFKKIYGYTSNTKLVFEGDLKEME